MSKLTIPYAEFYITNVCNLSCPGCNRFNNYKFTGYQRWDTFKEIYKKWSQEVDIKSMAILGGEPTLNPTFLDWVNGINSLWPKSYLRIISNGFRIDKLPDLYTKLKKNPNINLWVGIHNVKHRREIIEKVKSFTIGPHQIEFNSDNPYQQFLIVTDSNNVKIQVEYNWWFHQGAIINTNAGQTLHNSDPIAAHNICHMKTCHHFIEGKLYKCGVVALLPEYDRQHPLTLSDSDRKLMLSYSPLEVSDSLDRKINFINTLPNYIEQCKFCPEKYNGKQIFAIKK